MKRTPIESSMIHDVGYDPETKTLEIGFNSGTVYQYFDVEKEDFDGLMKVPSAGQCFLNDIEPFYACIQVRQTRRR
jgi:hypothetical protein